MVNSNYLSQICYYNYNIDIILNTIDVVDKILVDWIYQHCLLGFKGLFINILMPLDIAKAFSKVKGSLRIKRLSYISLSLSLSLTQPTTYYFIAMPSE